ncbi:hypothetical protein E2C01_042978 [Portunus trituberculatus]|uniref:Uncharacterized protein n=1 Tax=Portunus trituberculatus TaxID=210409 RepID=A0A5B7FRP4_PORTR|nr:hypothetical protein [Portunus trituberculatus]
MVGSVPAENYTLVIMSTSSPALLVMRLFQERRVTHSCRRLASFMCPCLEPAAENREPPRTPSAYGVLLGLPGDSSPT